MNKVKSAQLLATGKDVKFEQDQFRVRFTGLPEKAPDDPVTTHRDRMRRRAAPGYGFRPATTAAIIPAAIAHAWRLG